MSKLPASPSRAQALMEFEPLLHQTFNQLTGSVDREVRDAMHYALFGEADRFCASSAWLVAPRVGVATAKLAPYACAVETLRCSLAWKERASKLDPALVEAATYSLIPLAYEMLFSSGDPDRSAVAETVTRAWQPANFFKSTSSGMPKADPAFFTMGSVLERLSPRKIPDGEVIQWFSKLGLFAAWFVDFRGPSVAAVPAAQAMDALKSIEAELLNKASGLDLAGAAHEIIEPVAEILKARLQ